MKILGIEGLQGRNLVGRESSRMLQQRIQGHMPLMLLQLLANRRLSSRGQARQQVLPQKGWERGAGQQVQVRVLPWRQQAGLRGEMWIACHQNRGMLDQ